MAKSGALAPARTDITTRKAGLVDAGTCGGVRILRGGLVFTPHIHAVSGEVDGYGRVDPILERPDVDEVCRIDAKWVTPPVINRLRGSREIAPLSDSSHNCWLLNRTDCALRKVQLPVKNTSKGSTS